MLTHTPLPPVSDEPRKIDAEEYYVLEPGTLQHRLVLSKEGRRHPHFYFGDGNLILASSKMDFRVHIQKLVLRSTKLIQVLTTFLARPTQAIVYISILEDDPDDWACLLGLLYDEQGNSISWPTLRELFGILRISQKYCLGQIEQWAMTRLQSDFFPAPQYFQDEEYSEDAPEKLTNAIKLIRASHDGLRVEVAVLVLAYYAVARRPQSADKMPFQAWVRIVSGRDELEQRFEDFGDKLVNVACVQRPTVAGHDQLNCWQCLTHWMASVAENSADVLKVLSQMKDETPLGPICTACINDARRVVQREVEALYHDLPAYFGVGKLQECGWDIPEERKVYLSRSFRL